MMTMDPQQETLDFESNDEHLERVTSRIGRAIQEFCRAQRKPFHVEALRRHVTLQVGKVAPGSPDRVLRSLRSQGKINYRVLDRSQSLYEVIP